MVFKPIIISSGEYQGRFLGRNMFGRRTDTELLESPEIQIIGTAHSMYTQEEKTFQFIDANIVTLSMNW